MLTVSHLRLFFRTARYSAHGIVCFSASLGASPSFARARRLASSFVVVAFELALVCPGAGFALEDCVRTNLRENASRSSDCGSRAAHCMRAAGRHSRRASRGGMAGVDDEHGEVRL